MNVMLLSLPGITESDDGMFPLGIGYLAGMLKPCHKVEAHYYQKMRQAKNEIPDNIIAFEPDIVGLTCNTFNRGFVCEIVKLIRTIDKNVKIILGGVHASFLYREVLKQYAADIVVIGEGEYTLLELCNAIEQKIPLETVDGIAYTIDNEIKLNSPRQVISNLDDLPMPDYSYGRPFMERTRMGFIITSRGCPARCKFCSTSSYWGQKVRMHSPTRVVDEMEQLVSQFDVNKIYFHDDTFNLGVNRVLEICKEIKDRGIKVAWACGCRVSCVTEEMIAAMVEAGCRCITWGVESGSEEMLKSIDKRISLSQIRTAFELSGKFSEVMASASFTMVGNPGESEKTIQETVNFFNTLHMTDQISPGILYVLPGTLLYEQLKNDGHIKDEDWHKYSSVPKYTLEKSYWTLNRWANIVSKSGNRLPYDHRKHFWMGVQEPINLTKKIQRVAVQLHRWPSIIKRYLAAGRIRF